MKIIDDIFTPKTRAGLIVMTLKILIVGAGPAGCYLAQSLRKLLPECELTILDRLPVPFGLVRYGVAPDHQGTKAVTKQFARLFERQNVKFLGNICVGEDVQYRQLKDMFDIIVLSTGLSVDRPLGPKYSNLSNVYGAGQVTRFWNSHPDEANFLPSFGKNVIVIGNGNVALDVVRLLAKTPKDFSGSDISPKELGSGVEEIHLVGRSEASLAKFDPAMMRELSKIDQLKICLAEGSNLENDPDNKHIAAVHSVLAQSDDQKAKTLYLHFGCQIEDPIVQENVLTGINVSRDTKACKINGTSLITAIGFSDDGKLDRDTLIENAIDLENGHLEKGLYATGWFRRGPQGTIPENRIDAQRVAAKILVDYTDRSDLGHKPGYSALEALVTYKAVSYDEWRIIDRTECENAGEDRVRNKIKTVPEMLALIKTT